MPSRAASATARAPDALETSVLLWMSLHGRASVGFSMPGFPLGDEQRYLDHLCSSFLA
jgi:hypothetical protein